MSITTTISSPPNPHNNPILRFTTSWLLSPLALASTRALIALYIFTSIFAKLGTSTNYTAALDFSYFTSLTFWGLAFYFAVSSAHGFSYVLSARRMGMSIGRRGLKGKGKAVMVGEGEMGPVPWLARWPRWLRGLHSFFYSSVVTFPFLVTAIYWAVIYQRFTNPHDVWLNITQHALNSVFALFEILIPRTSHPPWYHALYLILILLAYMVVAYLTWKVEGQVVYSFLDYNRLGMGVVVGIVIGIGVLTVAAFFLVKGLIAARGWVTEYKMGRLGKVYGGGSSRASRAFSGSDWENVPEGELVTVELGDRIPLKSDV